MYIRSLFSDSTRSPSTGTTGSDSRGDAGRGGQYIPISIPRYVLVFMTFCHFPGLRLQCMRVANGTLSLGTFSTDLEILLVFVMSDCDQSSVN